MSEIPFSILRSPVWSALLRVVDEAVATQPSLAAAREALLRPVRLLELIARDAPLALGDDFLAAERLRATLALAQPFAKLPKQVAAIVAAHGAPGAYQPAVIHHGRLVIAALAAARVAPSSAGATGHLRTVLGLALAASPLEVLGRTVPGLPLAADLATLLTTLAARGAPGESSATTLQPFSADATERGRWQVLVQAFGAESFGADVKGPWDAAYADPIDDVESTDWPGEVHLVGRFSAEKPLLAQDKLAVVLVCPGLPPVAASSVEVLSTKTIAVGVAPTVRGGWIGFSSRKRIDDSNRFRGEVRARWRERSLVTAPASFRALLRDAPVPVEVIPDLGPALSAPPRTASNRFNGGRPALLEATIAGSDGQLRLFWSTAGATSVRLEPGLASVADKLAPSGTLNVPVPAADQVYTLTPVAERPDDDSGNPTVLEGEAVRLVAAAHTEATNPVPPADRVLDGVVLVRPVVLRDGDPVAVSADAARAALMAIAERRNVHLRPDTIRELPWIDDPLAVLSGDLSSGEDPRVAALLEELARVAARTAGFESALWLALPPDAPLNGEGTGAVELHALATLPGPPGFENHLPAEAALAVAVADRHGLDLLFSRLFPADVSLPRPRPATARLRLAGTVFRNGTIVLDPSREEIRAAGPGAPFESGMYAVALDADDRELQRAPVRTLREFTPARFVSLLPVSPEVSAVELRAGTAVLHRIPRTPAAPTLTLTLTTPDELKWTYEHPTSARASFEIELVDGPLSTPMLLVDPCARSLRLPVQRFRAGLALQVRLVASDGWNAAARTVDLAVPSGGTLVVRRAGRAAWWADTDAPGTFTWTLDGKEIGHGRVLVIDPRVIPRDLSPPRPRILTLTEASDSGALITDSRPMGDPDA